jgi:putative two-component system response regulator
MLMNNQLATTVLVVDDMRTNLLMIGELLKPHYAVRLANNGQRALEAAKREPVPSLILLDVNMPEMSGFEVLQHLKADPLTAEIPVIFVTTLGETENEEIGLQLGAADYLTKPIRPSVVLKRIQLQLELKRARDRLQDHNERLDREVKRRMRENELIKDVSVNSLALLAETRDNETGNHLVRTKSYVETLIRHLQDHPRFSSLLQEPQRTLIAKAAPLHDIGKVGIPDAILLKPGRLTVDEFEIMKRHSAIGAEAMGKAMELVMDESKLGDFLTDPEAPASLAFMETAREIALTHHEKWDGTGYPNGLKGDDIPVSGRLMALADVYDALTRRRHYKTAYPLEEVEAILTEGRGTHFDPDIVDAYFAQRDVFKSISEKFADADHA